MEKQGGQPLSHLMAENWYDVTIGPASYVVRAAEPEGALLKTQYYLEENRGSGYNQGVLTFAEVAVELDAEMTAYFAKISGKHSPVARLIGFRTPYSRHQTTDWHFRTHPEESAPKPEDKDQEKLFEMDVMGNIVKKVVRNVPTVIILPIAETA